MDESGPSESDSPLDFEQDPFEELPVRHDPTRLIRLDPVDLASGPSQVAIVSWAFGKRYNVSGYLAARNHRKYAARHGYRYHDGSDLEARDYLHLISPAAWTKVLPHRPSPRSCPPPLPISAPSTRSKVACRATMARVIVLRLRIER